MSNPRASSPPAEDRCTFAGMSAGFFAAAMLTAASLSFWALCGADPAVARAKHDAVIVHAGPVAIAVGVLAPTEPAVVATPAATPVAATVQPLARSLTGLELASDIVPVNAEGSTDNAPFAHIYLTAVSNGQAAIDALGRDLPKIAAWYGHSSAEFTQMLLGDRSLHVDRKGRLLYIDDHRVAEGPSQPTPTGQTEAGDKATGGAASTGGAPFALSETFALHTRSASSRVIYLNFQGEGSKPAFDLDKKPATFNDTERAMIQRIWLRVAEDFAAFDVDITTESPQDYAAKLGVTLLITNQTSDAGGYAYLNAFSRFKPNPALAFCFQNNLANSEKPIAECISHELGHTLGLHHMGDAKTTYYGGYGSGDTGWAPIMGVSYYKNLTQWAKGEYLGATNKEDAYVVMARQGLSPRADDHGNTRATATTMNRSDSGGTVALKAGGVIESPADVDMFSFGAGAGDLNLNVTPSAWSGNLDVTIELLDAGGKSLASANPPDKLGASLSVKLSLPGTYYLAVRGVGQGNPASASGYSNYGSVGQYNINGTAMPLPPGSKR